MQKKRELFNTKRSAVIGIICAVSMWGFDFVALDYILRDVSAPLVTLLRMAIAAAITVTYVIFVEHGWHLKRKADLYILILCGIIFMGFYYTIESVGIALTSGPVSSLIMAIVPVLGMIADRVFYKRKITVVKTTAIIGTVIGVGMIVMGPGADKNATPAGVAIMLLCCVIWTSYILFVKPYTERCSIMAFLSISFCSATVTCALMCLVQAHSSGLKADFHPLNITLIIISAVFCILIGEIIYVACIRVLSVTTASLAGNLLPVVTVLISFFVFGQTMSWLQLLGGALVIASVCVITVRE